MERGALEGTLPQAAGSEAVHSTDGTGLREPCAPRPSLVGTEPLRSQPLSRTGEDRVLLWMVVSAGRDMDLCLQRKFFGTGALPAPGRLVPR